MTDIPTSFSTISKKVMPHNILVIGDVMLDKYWFAKPNSLSKEAPVIDVKVESCDYRPGGAANVAVNIRSLAHEQDTIGLLAPIGLDTDGKILTSLMQDYGILCHWQYEKNKTITKHRIVSNKHQIVRVDFEEMNQALELTAELKKIIDQYQVIVISDYNKGCFSFHETPKIIQYARQQRKIVLVDPKDKDFSKYYGASMITPNMKEFIAATANSNGQSNVDHQAQELINKLDLDYLLLTQGADGMSLYAKNNQKYHACSYADEVYDVTGAGDTVIASMAVSFANSKNITKAVDYASYAAALVVSQVGTAKTTCLEVNKFMQKTMKLRKVSITDSKLIKITNQDEFEDWLAKHACHGSAYYKWDYISYNILTKNNISNLEQVQSKVKQKLYVIITTNVDDTEITSTLTHSINEVAFMLSQLSFVHKVIYSEHELLRLEHISSDLLQTVFESE